MNADDSTETGALQIVSMEEIGDEELGRAALRRKLQDELREKQLREKREREWEQRQEAEKNAEKLLMKRARALISAPDFLTRSLDVTTRLGVIGEENNRLIVTLGGVSRTLSRPNSVMYRGSPSSGKSSTMGAVLQLFHPEIVMERDAMSAKALFHGHGALAGKILLLTEYHAGKDARHLIRLAQTEGMLTDETTIVAGRRRSTSITERVGRPVVLTTTSELKIAVDDLSRFQVIWADESAEQSLRVMRSRVVSPPPPVEEDELEIWRRATWLLRGRRCDFKNPPKWLRAVPRGMPLERVGIRRDFERFITFLKSIALCRGCASRPKAIEIEFADYAVAYLIFEPIFISTYRDVPDPTLQLSRAVASLNREQDGPVTVNEVAAALGWKPPLVYKVVKSALAQGQIAYESGTHERNVKKLIAKVSAEEAGFLPHPRSILQEYASLGGSVTFTNPFSGESETLSLKKRGGGNISGVAATRCKHGLKSGVCAKCAASSRDDRDEKEE